MRANARQLPPARYVRIPESTRSTSPEASRCSAGSGRRRQPQPAGLRWDWATTGGWFLTSGANLTHPVGLTLGARTGNKQIAAELVVSAGLVRSARTWEHSLNQRDIRSRAQVSGWVWGQGLVAQRKLCTAVVGRTRHGQRRVPSGVRPRSVRGRV
jgi:hypothetical protein